MKKILLRHIKSVFGRIHKMLMIRSRKLREKSYQAGLALAAAPFEEIMECSKRLNKAADIERRHNTFVAKIDNLIIRINGSAGNDSTDGER